MLPGRPSGAGGCLAGRRGLAEQLAHRVEKAPRLGLLDRLRGFLPRAGKIDLVHQLRWDVVEKAGRRPRDRLFPPVAPDAGGAPQPLPRARHSNVAEPAFLLEIERALGAGAGGGVVEAPARM